MSRHATYSFRVPASTSNLGAGFDALVIRGKANRPVYLWITDGNVEISRRDLRQREFRVAAEAQVVAA